MDAGADVKLFVARKFTVRVPAGRTLCVDIVFQPTTARHHEFTLPVMLPGLSLPTSLIRSVSADGTVLGGGGGRGVYHVLA